MPANSFNRDLFELTHNEFHGRYKGPKSREEFAKLRVAACGSSYDKIIYGTTEGISGADSGTWSWASTFVVTRVYIKVASSDGLAVDVTVGAAVLQLNELFSEIDLAGLEESFSSIPWSCSAQTGNIHVIVFGYTPAAV